MNLEALKDFKFYLSLGYVVIISSILTIILMQFYKFILTKKKIITEKINPDKKDLILSKSGRFISLIVYSLVYIINEIILKNEIVLNESLIIGLLSGGAATLIVAKGLYTSLHQQQKRKNIFEKLSKAEEQLKRLQDEALQKQNKIILKKKEEKL